MAAAGGAGAALRFAVDSAIRARVPVSLPLGTMAINVSGSLLLGIFAGLVLFRGGSELWQLIAGTGFCGGFTTFSTACFEAVRLLEQRRRLEGLVTALGTLLLTVAAAALGLVAVAAVRV